MYEESNMLKIDTYIKSWVIDNRNLQGTFAMRRLNMDKETRYPLTLAIFNITQLIKYNTTTNRYIDYHGKLIKYKKTKMAKLKYFRVNRIKKGKSAVALFVKNLDFPIYVSMSQWEDVYTFDKIWLGLLDYNGGKLFYDFAYKDKGESWRKI